MTKQQKREYMRVWRAKNPIRRKELNQQYYARNRTVIGERAKARRTPGSRSAEGKAYYLKNRAVRLAYGATYRKEKAVEMKAMRDAWRKANPGKIQEGAYRRAGYPVATRPQPDKCESCGRQKTQNLHLDHCHTTGKFRGWLCGQCNRAAGLLGDTAAGVYALFVYLERNQ